MEICEVCECTPCDCADKDVPASTVHYLPTPEPEKPKKSTEDSDVPTFQTRLIQRHSGCLFLWNDDVVDVVDDS